MVARKRITVVAVSIAAALIGNSIRNADAQSCPKKKEAFASKAKMTHKRVDTFGDPLPDRALLRLGTIRWRHEGEARSLRYSPDGKILAGTSEDGFVFLWDATTGRELRRVQTYQGGNVSPIHATAVDFSPDSKVLACRNREEVQLWSVSNGKLIRRLPARVYYSHWKSVVRFSPNGKLLATQVGSDVAVFDLESGEKRFAQKLNSTSLYALDFSPNGKLLAWADGKRLTIANVATGNMVRQLSGKGIHSFTTLAFSRDGETLAGASNNITLWRTHTGKRLAEFAGKTLGYVVGLDFTPDGKTLISGSQDGHVRIWDLATGKVRLRLDAETRLARSVAVSKDGKKVAMGTLHCAIRQWDTATGKASSRSYLHGHHAAVYSATFSPDGRLIATGGADRKVFLWDAPTGRLLRQFADSALAVAFSPDGKKLASAWEWNKTVRIRDTATGKDVAELLHPTARNVYSIAFSKKKTLISATWTRSNKRRLGITTIHAWDVGAGRQIRELSIAGMMPKSLCATAVDICAVGGADGIIVLCDLAKGKITVRLRGHQGTVESMTFSPDARILISASHDHSIRLWEYISRGELMRLNNRSPVTALACSVDGRLMATGTKASQFDGVIRLWDMLTGNELLQLRGHSSTVNSLCFSPDGNRLISGHKNGTVLIWDVSSIPAPRKVTTKLRAADLPALWNDLAASSGKAYRAVRTLSNSPELAIPFLKNQMEPVRKVNPGDIRKWIVDLGSKSFAVRSSASRRLAEVAAQAESEIVKVLGTGSALEVRKRLEEIRKTIHGVPPPGILRSLRAIHALERMAAPEARELLLRLSDGIPDARVTRAARAAVERLASK